MLEQGTLGVIGAGVMGQALIKGLLSSKLVKKDKIWASTKTEASASKASKALGVDVVTDYGDKLKSAEIILVCVKPDRVLSVLEELVKKELPASTLVISIATGVTLEAMQTIDAYNPIIRAMPNTPSVVKQGMTVICPGANASSDHLGTTKQIFESVGKCIQLEEHHFDAITSLCGSGPAYMYLIMEALADGGVRVGLPRDVALEIVCQTVLGAATMVQDLGQHPAALRDEVTTPAGCTIAALLTMEDGKIRSTLARAVEEATKTAAQLGKPKV